MGLFTPTGKDLFVKPEDLKSGTVDQFLQGLAKKESSGNYKALGPVINSGMYTGDRAYGKYQIMGKNVPEWSQKYLGKKLTAEQLYQNEQLQDELMRKRAQELYSKYGNWEDVASVHFTGQPLKKAGNVKDQLGTTAPKYVQDVLAFMRGDSPAVKYQSPLTPGMAGSTPAMQDQTVWNTAMQNIGQHPLIQGPLKALDFVGTTIDKGFGIPARLGGAIGSKIAGGPFSDQGIPETMSGQLEEATTELTGSPTAGAVAGLLGSIAQPMPGPGKIKKIEKLADLGKTLYHSSPDVFVGGKPTFDAYFGGEDFVKTFGMNEFGPNNYKVTLDDKYNILDLNDAYKPNGNEAREFMAQIMKKVYPGDKTFINEILEGKKSALDDFYDVWTDKNLIMPKVKAWGGLDGVKFQDEYILPKETIEKLSIPGKKSGQDDYLYHGTSGKNLDSILKNGIVPPDEDVVFLTKDMDSAINYSGGLYNKNDSKVLLRVKKENIGDSFEQSGHTATTDTVKPQNLEFSTDNGKTWQSATPKVDPFVPGSLTTKILKKLEGRTTVSKQFIQDMAKSADVKQVEKNLILKALDGEGSTVNVANFGKKVEDQLVPLNVKIVGGRDKGVTMSATWSGVRLKEEVRGNVAGYTEKVYQSPVPTSSGNVHFRDKAPNYFGHTRVEDMGDKKTRRVLEVQSDLYQKGDVLDKVRKSDNVQEIKSLEAVKNLYDYSVKQGTDPEKAFQLMKKAKPNSLVGINSSYEMEQRIKLLQKQAGPDMEKYKSSIEKIEQYSNPTAHFRMAREEIAQASREGKTKVQFPTGETALKIEGLGGGNGGFTLIERVSQYSTHYNEITPEKLKVGQELSQGGGRELVVTKVLGDGKFKAIDKTRLYPDALEKYLAGKMDPESLSKIESMNETFDISTKVDTKNPIYKFYEDEMAKYLKNNYDAKLVKDKNGVTWYEVSVKPEMGTRPMDAFAMAGLPFAPVGYDQMTQAQENENGKETIQLNPFQPGFLSSSQTVNKIEPPAQPPAFTEDKKRAFQGNNSMNPDGLSRMGLNPLIPGGSKPDSSVSKPVSATNKPFQEQVIKPANQTYSLRNNKIQTNDEELRKLGAVLFGEMGIRTDKLELEAGIIANTILNRAENRGKPIEEILSQPYQYQAYNEGQYQAYLNGKPQKSKDPVVKAQVEAVNKVLEQIKNGTLQNQYGKVENYSHFYRDDNGKELPYGQYPIRVYTDPQLQKIEEWKTYAPKTWAKFSKAEKQRIIAKSKADKLKYLGIKTRQLTGQN